MWRFPFVLQCLYLGNSASINSPKNDVAASALCASGSCLSGFVGLDESSNQLEDVSGVYLLQSGAKKALLAQTQLQGSEKKPPTASDLIGVAANQAGDIFALLTALKTHIVTCLVCSIVFLILRKKYPGMYQNNAEDDEKLKRAPLKLSDSFLAPASMSPKISIDDVVESVGLDHGMLIQFSHLGMQMMLALGLPALCILMPLYSLAGGGAAKDDVLSWYGFANVEEGSWLCWVVAIYVWYVVIVVQALIFRTHENSFIPRRHQWLIEMPMPRANTVMVESIPEDYGSDKKLSDFFNQVFGDSSVKEVHFVKDTRTLLAAVQNRDDLNQELHEAEFKWEQHGSVDEEKKAQLIESVKKAEEEVEKLRHQIDSSDEGISNTAFVTFSDRQHSVVAASMKYSADDDEFVVSIPPDPSDVVYADLQSDWRLAEGRELFGYALIAGLFFGFVPIVAGISSITSQQAMVRNFPFMRGFLKPGSGFATFWDGIMGSAGLTLFMSFLPTFLVIIFSSCFINRADAWKQHLLQQWYFYFLVVFVLLVTAVGDSLFLEAKYLAEHPLDVFTTLAATLPSSTHFYLNYVTMQWSSHALNMLRYINLFKYLMYKQVCSQERSREMAEPEDQDFYGMGSRSARHTLILIIGIVLCTLSPLITGLVFVNFFWTRTIYAYLFLYAETKKADLGGVFWSTQMRHVQQGVCIYIVLMVGVLLQRAMSVWPAVLAASSFAFWIPSYTRFVRKFHLTSIPLKDLPQAEKAATTAGTRDTYKQPELIEPVSAKAQSAK
eukprot:TRINITY_DN6029_c2_g3_i1.p1 TRINITY_DN6029_c2_g3~~TRINITY_DN6029_c2_g3_i1.p1  ORF type:complete len:779 (+),score=136.30 TRINITY_DN6029_c2_g3_i1:119-2455(+)